jgi:poly-gamma-glutamate synthesis protein (capsule biosynthesis protein)
MHDIPYQVQVDNLKFNCKPEFLPEAAKYFQLINLANNHSGDQGYGPFDETRAALKKNNIQYFGHPDPAQTHETCEVIALPVRISKSDGSEQKAQLPVAFCAWHYFFRKPEPGEIETMRRYAEVMPVFAFVHMGTEYQASASSAQRDIAHAVIDNGASFVIANNPHWVQDSEAYKGKLIVYSTGNFIFDQQPLGRESTRSVSIDTTITLKYDNNVQRWLDLGPSCVTYQDDCLAKAEAQALQKPQLSFRYTAVAGDSAGVFTRRADAALQASVEERLGWTQTLKGLTQ